MFPQNERCTNKLRPLGISLLIVSALCGIAASAQPARADTIPGQILQAANTSAYRNEYLENPLISSQVFDTGVQTYHTSANLKIPDNLINPRIGHPKKLVVDINQNETTSVTNGLLWMPVLEKDNNIGMNILGMYGEGEHIVKITTTKPITADTPYKITGTIFFKKSTPNLICGIGLLPPWLCFKFVDPRYSGKVDIITRGIFHPKNIPSEERGSNRLLSVIDNTWEGLDVNASPTTSRGLYIQDDVGHLAVQEGAALQLNVVASEAPTPLTENAVQMDTYVTFDQSAPCGKISVFTVVSALDPASNDHLIPPAGTVQELSVSGAKFETLSPAERTCAGGIAANWGEEWVLSPLSGASSIAITSTMKYPCPTCLTQARLDVPGCHKTMLPVIFK
jgi:hypothetical protein